MFWFQSIEQKLGMDEAMYHDAEAWRRFTVIEAKRIKDFLKLPDNSGVEGLAEALKLRFYANINEDKIEIDGNTLIYTSVNCRVQRARERKGMPFHNGSLPVCDFQSEENKKRIKKNKLKLISLIRFLFLLICSMFCP